MINALEPTAEARRADPGRLVRAYANAAAAMNLTRAITGAGLADLHHLHEWNMDFVRESSAGERYERVAGEIDRSLRFMSACGVDDSSLRTVEMFASHEMLVLDYERSLLRSAGDRLYLLSAHQVWIGDRTRQLDGAHVALAALIANPIGVKIGPTVTPEEAVDDRRAARSRARRRARDAGLADGQRARPRRSSRRSSTPSAAPVIASCGSATRCTATPRSRRAATRPGTSTASWTRSRGSSRSTSELGTHPGGIHVEHTGEDVTECLGGAQMISHSELSSRYETACDPRLNTQQALELAFLVVEMLRR